MDRGPGRLQSTGSQSRTQLSDFSFTFFHFQDHSNLIPQLGVQAF